MTVRILQGDCREVLKTLPANSIDSIVTDPPYGLEFMGKEWDRGVPGAEFWRHALDVLKPGGHLLAFGGTRTYHRLVCAIEDAGFEIRDQIGWVYGSGFPKSHNLDGDWQGWGTALKPAWEPIVVARKPLIGTVAANVLAHGVGALNIDGCRVEVTDTAYARNCSGDRGHAGTRGVDEEGATNLHAGGGSKSALGRWPANVIHDGSDEVLAAFPFTESGVPTGVKAGGQGNAFGRFNGGIPVTGFGDKGSAARFFYCAKASKSDRSAINTHPTVKPTELMRYLCRLVTPVGGLVLDPFMGSGSTGKGAVLEGFSFTGIELDRDGEGKPIGYIEIATARIALAQRLAEEEAAERKTAAAQSDLFAEVAA